MSRIVPLVLNNETMADGEKATLLSVWSWDEPGTPEILLYSAPAPSRTSRLRTELVLQIQTAKFGFAFTVRSPLAASLGSKVGYAIGAPHISISPLGPVDAESGLTVRWLDAADDFDTISWPFTGAIETDGIAPGFSPTYNAMSGVKNIPNWNFLVYASDEIEITTQQVMLTIDFSHSIT